MGTGDANDPDGDVEEVISKELLLLRAAVRAQPDVVMGVLHGSFREFGASGRIWDRTSIAEALAAGPDGAEAEDLRALRLGADVVLVTYVARRADRRSLRSSVWVREAAGWQLVFHQGTPIPA